MKLIAKDIAVLALLWCFSSTVKATAVQFITETQEVTIQDGHIRLDWNAIPEAVYELERSTSLQFENSILLYKGSDNASFISGLEDGTYYFRVRQVASPWSETLTVHVEHQSLQLAFSLFTVGAVVFLLTVYVVVHGAMRAAKESL